MQHSIQVCKPGAETIDEFIENKFSLFHRFRVFLDFIGEVLKEFCLDACQRFGCMSATLRKPRIRLSPLLQLIASLPLIGEGTGRNIL